MTASTPIYLDTNVLILLLESQTPESKALQELLKRSRDHETPPFITSALTFSELLVRPYRLGQTIIAQEYRYLSHGNAWLSVAPVTASILDVAALLRAERRALKLPDAIHVASALSAGCSHLMTADTGIGPVSALTHPLVGAIQIEPLTLLRPDLPTLTSLLQSIAP
ncbi:hypothetical protein BJF92_14650 [Rhizobium rhizosphaerae]|uniref:PIN domain-containing protein n=1 Tax=Xaviernesmea rhizosphaerae TaxID=1672749 RepID=A0A1Q9ACL6_9HYPH|nr:PIN domain-containing protein [Xaviernesmea rhizosphaerae]OLP52650.1 hypothetical protein BJF92_14650 [Xaviernesmea rhizosphaerae]OQP84646.1 hypothetical protein BTR14_18650 [Xaviernesmea rhizosphaerae]